VIAQAGDEAAGGQCPGQQRRIVELAGDRQSLFGLIQGVDAAQVSVQDSFVRKHPAADRGRRLKVLGVEVSDDGIEPGQPFPDAAPGIPSSQRRIKPPMKI
jgi:hypothetical protein